MNIKPLLLALAIGVVPMASDAKDWSKEPLVAVQQAAKQGNADAQLTLGMMYSGGIEVAQDDKQAVAWYRKAAEQGDARAQNNLGLMYKQGKGVAQDDEQAVAWYRKAAEQGNVDAQFNLGVMYSDGSGVAQDYKQSYAWFSSAAANGHSNAVKARDIMAKRLTPAALAEGQQLATRYFEQYRPK